jgi:proline dehydrogenase
MEDDDLKQMQSVVQRLHTIAECAEERNVRLMVDAEQTYFQPAIRHIIVHVLMPKYNRERPLVFNTIQCYLKDARETLEMDVEYSIKSGFSYGVKLVRGAYLEQEREGAVLKGAPDPLWSSKAETNKCYNDSVECILKRIRNSNIQMMVATHNKESVKKTIEL